MTKRCRICGYPFAILISLREYDKLNKQINALFDITIQNGIFQAYICHQCDEIVTNMYEFYKYVKNTRRGLSDILEQQNQSCRICGYIYKNMMSVSSDSSLSNKIFDLFKIKVIEEDTLSTVICKPCQEIICNNWEFYVNVRKIQESFINEVPDDKCYKEISEILDSIPLNKKQTENKNLEKLSNLNNQEISKDCEKSLDIFENLPIMNIDYVGKLQCNSKEVSNINKCMDNEIEPESSSKHFNVQQDSPSEKHSVNNENKEFNEFAVNFNNCIISDLVKHPKCDTCKALTKSRTSLFKHYDSFHKEQPRLASLKLWKIFCNYRKTITPFKKSKMPSVGKNIIIFLCICCQRPFRSKLKVFHHERNYFFNKFAEYQCKRCFRTFDTKSCYNSHTMLHKTLGDFGCKKCGKNFLCKNDIFTHLAAHDKGYSNTCHICEIDFKTLKDLTRHKKSHMSSRQHYPFYCAVCGDGYDTKDLTTTHLLTHCLKKRVKSSVS